MKEKRIHWHHTQYETACGINPDGLLTTKNPVEVTCRNCRCSSKWYKAIKKYQAETEKLKVHEATPSTPKSPVIRVPKIHMSRRNGFGTECDYSLRPRLDELTDDVAKVTCENCKRTNAYKNAAKELKAKIEETKLAMELKAKIEETKLAMEPKEQNSYIVMPQEQYQPYTVYMSVEDAKNASQYYGNADYVILKLVSKGTFKITWDDAIS